MEQRLVRSEMGWRRKDRKTRRAIAKHFVPHTYAKNFIWNLFDDELMNCFSRMVNWRKAFSLISIWGHFQRFSPSRISDTLQAGFVPAQHLSWGFVEWRCAVVLTTTSTRTTPLHLSLPAPSTLHPLHHSLYPLHLFYLDNRLDCH